MRWRLRTKLIVGLLAPILLVQGATSLVLGYVLRADLLRQVDERLLEQARGAVPWLVNARRPEHLAARLAETTGTRVTILDAGGVVLGDSLQQDSGRETKVPWQEVEDARGLGVGWSTRHAQALGGDVRYVAVRGPGDTIVRLGLALGNVQATLWQLYERLLWLSGGAALLMLGLALAFSRVVSRPVRQMTEAAAQLARGNYAVRLPPLPKDELGALGETLSSLAEQLGVTIGELEAERGRLRQLEVVRREFVANVSHELRTPVAAIQGYADTLAAGDVEPATATEFLQIVQRQARRMGALIADLLRLAAAEAHAPGAAGRACFPVGLVMERSLASARPKAEAAAVTLQCDGGADLAVMARADDLERVLDNLLDNAIKHSAAHGTVSVDAQAASGEVVVRVRDEGEGIGAEHLPRLFERFYRVDRGRARSAGGTGLGLAIAKHLVEGMGGRITVESAPGVGSRFCVWLDAGGA